MTPKSDAKFEEMHSLLQKWHKFGEFLPEYSKLFFTLIGSFSAKDISFELNKVQMGYHDMKEWFQEWCKICRKTNLRFGKRQEQFGKCLPELSKVSKLGLW